MDGSDIAEVLAACARAAHLGTAFLCSDEAGTPHAHRVALRDGEKETVFTAAFSGRTVRGMRNAFIDAMADKPFSRFLSKTRLPVRYDDGRHRRAMPAFKVFGPVRDSAKSDLCKWLN